MGGSPLPLPGVWSWPGVWLAFLLLLLLLLAAFALYCCYVQTVHWRYDYIPGAPRANFLFGHIPYLWKSRKNKELLYNTFLQWAEEYGPILRFNAFHTVTVFVYSPEGVKEYLMLPQYPKDPKTYDQFFSMLGVRFLGDGLVTERNYERWHKQRRIMDPAFSRTFLIGLMGTFNDQAEELMNKLDRKADGETKVGVEDLLRRVTLDIIAKVAFGLELNTLQDDQTPFPHAVTMVGRGMTEKRDNLFFKYMPWNRKVVKDIQESLRLLRHTGKECIDRRRKAIEDGEEIPLDILTQLLKSEAEEGSCDEQTMVDNFVTFFFAGHETTAGQLSFAIRELGQQPEIVARLQAEIDEVIGMKRDIAYEDLGKLEYLSQVLKETLRLYPSVPTIARLSGKGKIIEGVKIPPTTTLFFSTYIMGRMERYFKDPLTFNPDRFSKDQPRPYYCYFPFSLGPRSCIGQVFSQMEAKVVLAKFLQRFEFQLVPVKRFAIVHTGSLRPADDVICILKPRRS